jgi:hypothetical protein
MSLINAPPAPTPALLRVAPQTRPPPIAWLTIPTRLDSPKLGLRPRALIRRDYNSLNQLPTVSGDIV